MTVLHIISGGESGGSKKHLLSLLDEMKKRDIKNILVCFIEGELYKEAKEKGLSLYLIKQEKRFDLSVVNKIKDLCIKEDVDLVNSHGGRANFICYFLKKKLNKKFVTTIHSDYESDYKGNKYKSFLYTKLNKFALKSFDYYIAVSGNFKKMLINRGFEEKKVFKVYNGIVINNSLNKLSSNEIIEKYNIPRFDKYIVSVARLHPIKGHKDFLDACELIYNDIKNVGIVLVGDGSLKDELKYQIQNYNIKDNVVFVGFKNPDDFFALADFTVLTSYSESFPLVILESGLYSKTVIASNVGGIPEIIKDMENGMLINPGNSEDISNKIKLLLNDKELSISLGNNLREDVVKKFSIEALANSYEEIWNKILLEE